MAHRPEATLSDLLDLLVADALRADVPEIIAIEARRATRRRMAGAPGSLTSGTRRRAEAYFSAVVRRRAVRRGAAPKVAARLVVSTIVEDLRACGRDGAAIWTELERGWAGAVPSDVLEEYRLRLCG